MPIATGTPKPDKPYDHRVETPDGHHIDVHAGHDSACAFLALPGKDHNLSVVSERSGLNYIGYRDGKCGSDCVAVSVDPSGDGDEYTRVRELSLDQLRDLVRSAPPEPA